MTPSEIRRQRMLEANRAKRLPPSKQAINGRKGKQAAADWQHAQPRDRPA